MERQQLRQHLLACYAAALQAVHGRTAVHDWLSHENSLHFPYVIAIGKAAPAMLQGALDALQEHLVAGLLITKLGYADPALRDTRIHVLEAEHPVPGEGSLAAGQALLDFLAGLPADAPLLFLVSGGASALVEVLPDGVTLADLRSANDWLLAYGWDITRINQLRRQLSCIKGGKLRACLGTRKVLNLLISDVPGDDPAIIGSGLLVPPSADVPDGVDRQGLPAWMQALLEKAGNNTVAGNAQIHTHLLRSNHDARVAAAACARERGFAVHETFELLQDDALQTGRDLARQVLHGPPGFYLWGGETTVQLPAAPGRGGRCQSLALAAAEILAGSPVVLLAAGTDGSDGPTEDAGALVDGRTVERGRTEGWLAAECLLRADAGTFLEASGDLLQSGPTGSNVMDLVMAIQPAETFSQ